MTSFIMHIIAIAAYMIFDAGDSHQTSSGSHILPESPHVGCAQITEKRDFDLLNSYLMQSSGNIPLMSMLFY